jgi:hypothetical protein
MYRDDHNGTGAPLPARRTARLKVIEALTYE